MPIMLRLGLWLIFPLIFFGCKESSISPKRDGPGLKILSISPIPRLAPAPSNQDSLNAIDLVASVGARGQYVAYKWSHLEPLVGTYALSDFAATVRYLTKTRGFGLLLGLQVLNTSVKETPPDLLATPFDSLRMIQRFHALVDTIAPYINSNVWYVSIGNEIDVFLSHHPEQWAAYEAFYRDAVQYIHHVVPSVRVGVTVTFDGAIGQDAGNIAAITSSSDVCIFTYYPLTGNFQVRDPTSPAIDFQFMLDLAGPRLVIVQETGYPSDTLLGSSEQKQAEFISCAFSAWAAAPSRLQFVNFFALHDLSRAICDTLLQYYGIPDTASYFKSYLCSLGLRQADDTPKQGWQRMVNEARSYIP